MNSLQEFIAKQDTITRVTNPPYTELSDSQLMVCMLKLRKICSELMATDLKLVDQICFLTNIIHLGFTMAATINVDAEKYIIEALNTDDRTDIEKKMSEMIMNNAAAAKGVFN